MSRRDEHLDDVLCHCGGDDDGHSLADERCAETVKADPLSRWGAGLVGGSGGQFSRAGARGTCRECGPTVVDIRPAMSPHKHAGADCPGAGQVPIETKHAPGRLLASWLRDFGAERLVER